MNKKPQKTGKLLIVDDNEDLLRAARMFLKRHFLQIDIEKNPESIPTLLANEQYDVILLDMNFTKDVSSGAEGFYWLDRILKIDPMAVVVLITAYGDVEMAVRAMREGASDFVLKPWENEKLLETVHKAMKRRSNSLQPSPANEGQAPPTVRYPGILGQSTAMNKVFDTIDRVAKTDANVLILGENGTGKELIAQAIHDHSERASAPFAAVDLGSITETLFESELFGHVKGAFTDAKDGRAGRFAAADGGTLFLDEIGNLSLPLQSKLLTALQKRQVVPVGSNTPVPVNIRLICATNMPLYNMVQENTFRQDLLYRVNTIEVKLPALNERMEDIALLAEHFLGIYANKYNKEVRTISQAAVSRMQKYHWPGNVRELQHTLERAVIMSTTPVLQPEDFFFNTQPNGQPEDDQGVKLDQLHLEEVEKILIRKALKKFNGNITQAATELGLTRSSLYRRLEKYGL